MADYLDEDGVLTLWEKNKELASTKQDTLVSGENIRTVNGMSLLGSGNIALEGGSGGGSSEIKAAMSIDGTLEVTGSVKANDVQATMFMIPNGTSEQVLMADGSTKNISEIGGNGEDDRYSQLLGLLSESPYNIPDEGVVAGEYVWDDGSDNSEGFAGLTFTPYGESKMLSYNDEFGWQEQSSAWTIPNIPVATTTSGGVMSPEDKVKLDAIDPTSKSPFTHGTGTNSAVIDSDTYCEATGVSSFAMGIHAKAIGEASVAMGRYTKAEGRASFAMGGALNSTYVTGEANATEYIATNIMGAQREDVTLLIGYDILEYRTDGKNAYLATIINAEQTDTLGTARITVDKSLSEEAISNMRFYLHCCRTVGRNSVILGAGGAHGAFSTVTGCFNVAAGDYATAIGYGTIAAGLRSFSSGYYTKAEGTNSHTEGSKTHAIGINSHAEGQSTRAEGDCSHTEGQITRAEGTGSHAEGGLTRAEGTASHAEGGGTYNIYFTGDGTNSTYLIQKGSNWQCIEDLSKLIGGEIIDYSNYNTVATIQSYSLADDGYTLAVTLDKSLGVLDKAQFGIVLNIASGHYSHTQNGATKASGKTATSMGSHTIASGESSLATGDRTFATGTNSSTHGENTHALNKNEAAFGVSNISHNGEGLDAQTLFSIGCGDDLSGMDMNSRIEQRIPFPKMEDGRNAVEVMRNGDIWYGGYNTGVKIWDATSRKSPYLTDPNGTNQQVLLGDGSLRPISELSPITDADAEILLDNHIHSINVNANGNDVNISVIESSKNGDAWETEDNDITIPLATTTSAGVMSKEDKAKLDALGSNIGGVGVPETLNCNTTYVVELEADDNLSITGFVAPTTLFGNYTVHLKTSTNNSISLPSTLLWANGEQPVFEDNTCYELSITATFFNAEYVYKAVLVAFK